MISTTETYPSVLTKRRSLFWRIHFWAALIASPFALLAALTGILYLFSPQIEQYLYAHLDHVQVRDERLALDTVVAAAQAAMPHGATLNAVFPAQHADDSVRLLFISPQLTSANQEQGHSTHGAMRNTATAAPLSSWVADAIGTSVYVDPYSAQVLGIQTANTRFSAWSKKLHSQLLQGEGWRWMIELAASWLMVMLLTGIWLWWPRRLTDGVPERDAVGRRWWSQWHAFLGVTLSILSFVMLTTGLTWSKYAGSQIRWMRDAVGQQSPQAPRGLRSTPLTNTLAMNWQQANDATQHLAPNIALRLIAPSVKNGTWRVMSANPAQALQRTDMLLDAYSGKVLFRAGWRDQTIFGQATGIGIPFHRGELGWWNQLLLLVFGLGILFSLISGWVMFVKRRQTGAPALPKLLPGAWRAASPLFWLVAIALCIAMPVLAVSATLVLLLEFTLARQRMNGTAQ
tara:strand:+ start:239307 stop:240680 length:1374 start_codon:yes stop_codon:yes gene_type:complete